MTELLEGLTWRDIGLGTALLIYIIINHWRDVVDGVRRVYDNHALHTHDKREFTQAMAEREYDNRAQTGAAQLTHKIAVDHQAFGIVERLLDEKQNQLDNIRESLLKITELLAKVQLAEDDEAKRHERRLRDLSENLRQQWGLLANILDELKRINGKTTKQIGDARDNE